MLTTRLDVGSSSAKQCVRVMSPIHIVTAVVLAAVASIVAHPAQAQTWATPGVSSDIGAGGNWVGGTPPAFDGTANVIFSASTNTTVKLRNVTPTLTTDGDYFSTVTFDATAPAYTFTLPTGNTTNELQIAPAGNLTNSSANTQNLTGIAALTLNGTTPAVNNGVLLATGGNPATNLSIDVSQIKFNNPGSTSNGGYTTTSLVDLTGGYDVRTSTLNGIVNGSTTSSLYVHGDLTFGIAGDPAGRPAGTLFITGESANPGRLVIAGGGVVRINHNNALGEPGNSSATNATLLLGGGQDGRVELVGNITTNEAFTLNARQNNTGIPGYDPIHAPAISSVSGTNTLTGTFRFGAGGNAYNFGAESGATLVIQSDLPVTTSAERYVTFQHAGNILMNGNIRDTNTGTTPDLTLVKFDSGTTTINGSNNTKIGHLSIRGGTLALGSSAVIGWANTSTDILDPDSQAQPEGLQSRVLIDAGATFDVTAITGGYNLTQTLQGNGTVRGQINMASGTRVRPGDIAQYDAQGMSVNGFLHPNPVGSSTDVVGVGKLTFQGGGGGDYNGNGITDAADYALWRKNPATFGGNPAGYNTWRTNFGSSTGGGLNMSAGAILVWQLAALSTSNPGVDFDQVAIDGSLTLGGTSNLTLDFGLTSLGGADPNGGNAFWNSPHSWKIIDTLTNTGSTNFASITNGTFTPGHFTTTVGTGANAGDIFLNYVLGAGAGLSAGTVPEPATIMLVALGAVGGLLVRKR